MEAGLEPEPEPDFNGNGKALEYPQPSICRLEQVVAYRHEGVLLHHWPTVLQLLPLAVGIVALMLAGLVVVVVGLLLALVVG